MWPSIIINWRGFWYSEVLVMTQVPLKNINCLYVFAWTRLISFLATLFFAQNHECHLRGQSFCVSFTISIFFGDENLQRSHGWCHGSMMLNYERNKVIQEFHKVVFSNTKMTFLEFVIHILNIVFSLVVACLSFLKYYSLLICIVWGEGRKTWVHPKLYNIKPHNVIHSLIVRNHRERLFVVKISLLIVTFFSLISRILSLMQPPKKSIYTLALHHMSIRGVPPSYSYSSSPPCATCTCWILVHACATLPGKAKWSGPHHTKKKLHFVLFHSVTCYTHSIVTRIHVNNTKP